MRRENLNQSKIFTLLITGLLGIALVFMGLDLDMQVVWATIKVTYLSMLSPHHKIYCLAEACWSVDWDGQSVCSHASICIFSWLGFLRN